MLAHAYVQAGDLEKARDYYLKLTQLEPQNQLHANNYQQVAARASGAAPTSKLITPEEGAVLVDELEATAPFIDQRYPDEVALALRSALTDASRSTRSPEGPPRRRYGAFPQSGRYSNRGEDETCRRSVPSARMCQMSPVPRTRSSCVTSSVTGCST